LSARRETRAVSPYFGPIDGNDGSREKPGVDRAGFTDRERSHRHAGRHLYDREKRVDALQRFRLDRNTQDRNDRFRGRHSREMGRSAGAGDDHFDSPRLG